MRRNILNWIHVRSTWTAQGETGLEHNTAIIFWSYNSRNLARVLVWSQKKENILWMCSNGQMEKLPLETAHLLHMSWLRGKISIWQKKKKDVKWGRLLLGNCYDPPEMSVSDMEGDPASNTHLYICCKSAISACHCLSIYVIVFNSHTQSLKHERLIRNTHHNNHVTFEYIWVCLIENSQHTN